MKKIRFLAFTLIALLLAATLTGCGQRKPEGLFGQASGLDPASTIAAINGRNITVEEYLYWLSYHCETMVSERGDIEWNKVISDDVTYGEYARRSALATVIQFSVARDIAVKYDVRLTDEDRAQLQQKKDADVLRYGGADGYQRHLDMLGVSEAAYDRISENYQLVARLVETAGTYGSSLYPSQATLDAFMKGRDYATVRLITLPTSGLDENGRTTQEALLTECVDQIRQAEDPCAKMEELAKSLGVTADADQTLGSDVIDLTLMRAVKELETGEVSDVITIPNAMCIALRRPLDEGAIARDCFRNHLAQERTSAKVEVTESYKNLDVGKFYTALVELRQNTFGDDSAIK